MPAKTRAKSAPAVKAPPPAAPPAPKWPADKVERWPIARLVPYARNARLHSPAQVDQIAGSIREWGWTIPVLVDEDGTLIAGHGRVLAAHKLGIDAVPTMVADGWSEAQKAAYRIADNQLVLSGGWDDELLRVELGSLFDGGNEAILAKLGFTELELEKLLGDKPAPEGFESFDEAIETEHQCPKCGYRWSGKAGANGAGAPADE